jgi:ElaB/YqjD/DUF883 family membrane-anchored ribosome-binding protein
MSQDTNSEAGTDYYTHYSDDSGESQDDEYDEIFDRYKEELNDTETTFFTLNPEITDKMIERQIVILQTSINTLTEAFVTSPPPVDVEKSIFNKRKRKAQDLIDNEHFFIHKLTNLLSQKAGKAKKSRKSRKSRKAKKSRKSRKSLRK